MLLAQEQDVLDLVGQSQRSGNNSTAKNTLRHATSQIENHLGTSLVRAERVDYFGCPRNFNNNAPPQSPSYMLNLTAGFIDLTQPFEVFYTNDENQILDITDPNAELQLEAAFALDADLGRLTLWGSTPIPEVPFRGIAVHYTSGFEVDEHEIAQDVPIALQNGAATVAASSMRTHSAQATNRTPWKDMQSSMRRSATGMLSAYIRPRVTGDDRQYTETL